MKFDKIIYKEVYLSLKVKRSFKVAGNSNLCKEQGIRLIKLVLPDSSVKIAHFWVIPNCNKHGDTIGVFKKDN